MGKSDTATVDLSTHKRKKREQTKSIERMIVYFKKWTEEQPSVPAQALLAKGYFQVYLKREREEEERVERRRLYIDKGGDLEMKMLVTSCSLKQLDICETTHIVYAHVASSFWITGYQCCAYLHSIKTPSSLSHQTFK